MAREKPPEPPRLGWVTIWSVSPRDAATASYSG